MIQSQNAARSPGEQGIRSIRIAALAAAMLQLAACGPTNYAAQQESRTPMAPDAPTQIVVGSRLTLRVPLELPASGAPLLFQGNAIATQSALARNAPYCRFAGSQPGAPRTLAPMTFTVRDIDYDDRSSAAGPRAVAVTHYALASGPQQPQYVLSCQWPEGAPALAFVTTDEVQATVSAFFRLDPAL